MKNNGIARSLDTRRGTPVAVCVRNPGSGAISSGLEGNATEVQSPNGNDTREFNGPRVSLMRQTVTA